MKKIQSTVGYKRGWMLGAFSLAIVCLLSLAPGALAGKGKDPRATGLPELTPEELEYQNQHQWRVQEVKLNRLGLVRVNSDRMRKGKKQITEEETQLASFGEELVATVGPGAGTASTSTATADAAAAMVPTYVDNSRLKFFPPIRSQGSLNSCGPFSGTYYTMTYMAAMARDLDAKAGGDQFRLSPKWTYNMLNGGSNTGSWYYKAFEIGLKHGCATWQEFPYDSNYLNWCLNPTVWRNSISRRFDTYGFVDSTHLDSGMTQVKQMLANGYILNFATYIYSWQTKAIANDPSTSADDAFAGKSCCYWVNGNSGYHAMTVVGFNDDIWVDINANGVVEAGEKGAFRIANSWGTGWMEAGFSWMAYDALRSTSAVSGGPSTGRITGWYPTRAHWVTALPSYTPVLLAEFTMNHAQRNQMRLSLGVSDPTQSTPSSTWTPAVLWANGGAYAFNGTTTPVDGTFVFDFSDIALTGGGSKRFYLNMTDSALGSPTTLKSFKLIDLSGVGGNYVEAIVQLLLDNTTAASSAAPQGAWAASTASTGFVGTDYLHDGNVDKGTKTVTFTPDITAAGPYEVFIWYTAAANRASNVPVDVAHEGGVASKVVDQRSNGSMWNSLGTYNFAAGSSGYIQIRTTGTDGYVVADAVKLVPATASPGTEIVCSEAPKTVDGTQGNAKVDYDLSGGTSASFTVAPGSGYAPLNVLFDGSASVASSGAMITAWDWDFGDGGLATGATVEHMYMTPGSYTATLTVTDDLGRSASSSTTIVVSQDPSLVVQIHLAGIDVSVTSTRSGRSAKATVRVVEESGTACPGATVTGQWSGAVSGPASGTTAADGSVSFSSPKTKSTGAFYFTVTGVSKTGYLYDPTQNVVSSASAQ